MVTLKDIAKLAGVSPMTVSRVVNNQFDKVSEQTVARIKAIIKERGYVPNSSARSLSSKSTRLIAIIVQGEESTLEYPYNAMMTGYISHYIQSHGYSPILYFIDDYREITRRLRSWNVDGAVFLGMFDDNMQNIQDDNSIPLVFMDSYSKMRQVINIGLDDYKGGYLAGRHLIEMGHRDIAFIGTSVERSSVVRQRLFGLRGALEEAGLALPESRIVFDSDFRDAVRRMCTQPPCPTAFFVPADIDALRLMDYLRTLDLRIPEDCSVIGFDDLYFSGCVTPRLTTIAQDIRLKAQTAGDVLFRHIENRDLPAETIILDVKLIQRESVRRIDT